MLKIVQIPSVTDIGNVEVLNIFLNNFLTIFKTLSCSIGKARPEVYVLDRLMLTEASWELDNILKFVVTLITNISYPTHGLKVRTTRSIPGSN